MNRARHILLVEDSDDDIQLTLRAFRKTQFASEIAVVRDGEEALDYLLAHRQYADRGRAPPPEVVLLDLNLPRMDGLELLRRLRAEPRTRRMPVVVLTSSNEEQDRVTSYDLGANSFVRKPVDYSEFVAAARQLGLYWLMLNEPPPVSGRRGQG